VFGFYLFFRTLAVILASSFSSFFFYFFSFFFSSSRFCFVFVFSKNESVDCEVLTVTRQDTDYLEM